MDKARVGGRRWVGIIRLGCCGRVVQECKGRNSKCSGGLDVLLHQQVMMVERRT